MENERRFQYRGCAITTRWVESQPRGFVVPRRFTASFSVDSRESHDSSWQQFPEGRFTTSVFACEHALKVAKDSIDRHVAERRWPVVVGPDRVEPTAVTRRT